MNPEDDSEGARLYYYGDLFREVADALKNAGLLENALRYYSPLQQTDDYADTSYYVAMGECCMALSKFEEAESCFLTVVEYDPNNVESRVQLAKLYEHIGMTEQAFKYVTEAVQLGRQESGRQRRRKDARLEQLAREFQTEEVSPNEATPLTGAAPSARRTTTLPSRRGEDLEPEWQRTEHIQFLYSKMMQLQPKMKQGDVDATEDWLDIADALLRDFRSNRVFYPLQRRMVFSGYTRETQKKNGRQKNKTIMVEMQEMAGRLQESLGRWNCGY